MIARSGGSSIYTWLIQPWPGRNTFYTQLERADPVTLEAVTVSRCHHRHRSTGTALNCKETTKAFLADEDPAMRS